MTTSSPYRPALAALFACLALTVAVIVVPYATTGLMAEHIRSGYPSYPPESITTAVTTYLILLTVFGAFTASGWLVTIRFVRQGKRRARALAVTLAALSTTVGLAALLVRDTSGDVGLPPLLGWTAMAPALAGLVAAALLLAAPARPIDGRDRRT
jgi:hypothetical protein